ncbi:MAG TPA: hypothetical protein VKR06_22450, partial [Ktedonosporobacter sp.]|nr:hypothetical protein [Ktedonosporobacter sp.]
MMNQDQALVVPIQLSALVVNQQVRQSPFRRWEMDYFQLAHYASPEPDPFGGEIESSFHDPKHAGVYLHWTLPQALRHGEQNRQTGKVEFPLLPNRWLVVRYQGIQPKAWIIESDCPNAESDSSSLYLVDSAIVAQWCKSADLNRNSVNGKLRQQRDSPQPRVEGIGKSFPLQGWQEQGIDELFLRAVPPANPIFTAYQPHVNNILSFHDRLNDDSISKAVVSYLVVGWYSNLHADPVSSWQKADNPESAYQKLLDAFNWKVSGNPGDKATRSLYYGVVHGVNWDEAGPLPPAAPQTISNFHVAVGNTGADAFTALIAQQLKDSHKYDPKVVNLLEAFQYQLLDELNQPGGGAIVQQHIHQAQFGAKPGGYRWTFAARDSKEANALRSVQTPGWLESMNQAQVGLDDAVQQLHTFQWNLYAMWWKKGKAENAFPLPEMYPKSISPKQFEAALDPTNGTFDPGKPEGPSNIYSLPLRVFQQRQKVAGLLSRVPQFSPQDGKTEEEAFQAAIDAFAKQKGLKEDLRLKAIRSPQYWRALDPVVIISGVNTSGTHLSDVAPVCRLDSQLVTGVKLDGTQITAQTLGNQMPSLDVSHLPPGRAISGLLQEFFFLNPASAPLIAAAVRLDATEVEQTLAQHTPGNYNGMLPTLDLAPWQQPWNPIFMEWSLDWYPIESGSDQHRNWTFDGTDYHFTGQVPAASPPSPRQITGRIFLTSQTTFNFRSRLTQFLQSHPDADLKALDQFIEEVDQWNFLSQALTGFNAHLSLIDSRANLAPDSQHVLYD